MAVGKEATLFSLTPGVLFLISGNGAAAPFCPTACITPPGDEIAGDGGDFTAAALPPVLDTAETLHSRNLPRLVRRVLSGNGLHS